ncbi:MAG: glycosyltransferase family 2 protein [Gaiellaceae bacterium]
MGAEARDLSIAVVIVNHNAGALLEQSLSALDRQTLPPRRVIVVDNASSDGSADGLEERHPHLELVRVPENRGFAAANNIGVRIAEGCDWVALLNPDAFPEPGWLEALARAACENPEYEFFASRLLDAASPTHLDGTGDLYHASGFAWRRDHGCKAEEVGPPLEEVFSACAAAALYRRHAFLDVGGFDESYFCYYEDSDLSFRLRLTGRRCLYVADAVVHHVGSAITGRESDFALYHSYRNLLWTYAKNMPSPLVWRYLPHCLLMNGLILTGYAVRGRGRVVARAQRHALRGLPRVLTERRMIQSACAVPASELQRVLSVGSSGYAGAFGRAWELWFRKAAARRRPAPATTASEPR